jgi:hypothetical protein
VEDAMLAFFAEVLRLANLFGDLFDQPADQCVLSWSVMNIPSITKWRTSGKLH